MFYGKRLLTVQLLEVRTRSGISAFFKPPRIIFAFYFFISRMYLIWRSSLDLIEVKSLSISILTLQTILTCYIHTFSTILVVVVVQFWYNSGTILVVVQFWYNSCSMLLMRSVAGVVSIFQLLLMFQVCDVSDLFCACAPNTDIMREREI